MWPEGFVRIPSEDLWVQSPIEELARKYDAVQGHSWYRNLEPILDDLHSLIREGDIIVDYSGGTGILVGKLLGRHPGLRAGFVLVDASPKFLRLALDKLGADERIAFRWLRYLKDEKRLQSLDEVLPQPLCQHGVDVLCSTNAIHLYENLSATLGAWARVLKPGATVLVQSGNMANPNAPEGSWIIDTTVERLQPIAHDLVRDDAKYARFRSNLEDAERTAAYDQLRKKYFLPVRPLSHYLDALRGAGFEIVEVFERLVEAQVSDWVDFLNTYHEGVLGWAGGSKRIDGVEPSEEAVTQRQQLLRESLTKLFEGQSSFSACWTYVKCRNAAS